MVESLRQSWVVLTQGDRNAELCCAIRSVLDVGGTDIALVVNGAPAEAISAATEDFAVTMVALPSNVGIPAGRTVGMNSTTGDIVFYLDDDATVITAGLVAEVMGMFSDDPRLGIVGFRLVDPQTGDSDRRHVPRLGGRGPDVSGEVTAFLGGACAIRRECWEAAGGYDDTFFYAMEESDLALRVVDADWRIWYRGDLLVGHPSSDPTRHRDAVLRTSRNRALLARKNLPQPLATMYLMNWTVITTVRQRSLRGFRAALTGLREGYAATVDRRPISWRSVVRLTRLGRPPVI